MSVLGTAQGMTHKLKDMFVGVSALALPALGIYILVIAETVYKKDKDLSEDLKLKYHMALLTGIAFIIFGSGALLDILGRIFGVVGKVTGRV